MKKLLSLIVLLFLYRICAAQESASFSSAKLLLFHPEMQYYHFGLQSFFRKPLTPDQTIEFIDQLYQELWQLEKKRQETTLKLRQEQQKKIEELPRRGYKYVREIQEEYTEKIKEQSLKNLQQQEELVFQHFLNPAERNQKIKYILTEIEQYTEKIKKQLNLQLLFHDSLTHLVTTEVEKFFYAGQEDFFHALQHPEFLLGRIFLEIDNAKRLVGLHQAAHANLEDFNFGIDPATIQRYLRRYTTSEPYRTVFVEGPDITGDILAEIYKKYRLLDTLAWRLAGVNYVPAANLKK